jgi:murein hydrolase activator
MERPIKWFIVLTLILSALFSFAQTRKELENKRAQLKKEIEESTRLLQNIRKEQKTSLNELVTLNKKINMRIELIRNINDEIGLLNTQIGEADSGITRLEDELKKLKEDYAKMIYFAYKNQNAYQRLMFLFSSDDFNQAYKRLKYLQQYSIYRQHQAGLIEKTQTELTERKAKLQEKKKTKMGLLGHEESERKNLTSEKNEQLVLIGSLKDKEKKLRTDLADKQKAEQKLNKAIEDVIRREIENARKVAAAAGKKNITATNALASTPEAIKLSNDFAGNQGKLPWPVDQGVITGTFGDHPHPVLKGIITKNNGIDINTRKGAMARSVFDGSVSGVVTIPGANKAVIIRHGEYLSVYSNLEEVYVKTGENVTTKQSVGLVHTNEEEAKTELHLEIWKGTTKLDPSGWLFNKR